MAGGTGTTLIYLIALVAIFYFLLIRPQQKRAKEHRELVASLKVGDKVVTVGGVYGTIKSLAEDMVSLQVASNVRITVSRTAIGRKQEG